MHLAIQLKDKGSTSFGPLVQEAKLFQFSLIIEDRDQTDSRRSKPSSRTALFGEQPNPWELFHPQDAMSRHRGVKPLRLYGLLAKINLLSPSYFLSFQLCLFHTKTQDHYDRLTSLLDL